MMFSELIRTTRESRGLTQQQLADAAGVPIGTLRNHEQGHRLPSFPHGVRYAITLGIGLESLAACEELGGAVAAAKPMGKRK